MTTEKLFSFIENSPTAFHAIEAMRCRLKAEGYQPLLEGSDWNLQAGGKLLCDPQRLIHHCLPYPGKGVERLSDHGKPQRFPDVQD